MPDGSPARWGRLLYREDAAEYVGVSAGQFDKEVAAGIWPRPLTAEQIARMLGLKDYSCRRVRWDRKALDRVVDRITGVGEAFSSERQELDEGL